MSKSRFNLEQYLAFIGLEGYEPKPTLECLSKVAFQHVATFPYQNRRLRQEGKKPDAERQMASLDPNVLFDEMVIQKAPAYCYQHLTLLHEAIRQIGFITRKHLSKVILKPRNAIDTEALAKNEDSHILMSVNINGCEYIVDSGFANESLRQPLPLAAGEHRLNTDHYLLEDHGDYWLLNSKRHDRDGEGYWFGLFRFNKKAATEEDIAKAHYTLYHCAPERMPIRSTLLLYSRVTKDKRKFVSWDDREHCGMFRSVSNQGKIKETTFDTEKDVVKFAHEKFKLN